MSKPLSHAERERRRLARMMAAYNRVWPILLDLKERRGAEAVRRVIRATCIILDVEERNA